jgi:hypothetical protein
MYDYITRDSLCSLVPLPVKSLIFQLMQLHPTFAVIATSQLVDTVPIPLVFVLVVQINLKQVPTAVDVFLISPGSVSAKISLYLFPFRI